VDVFLAASPLAAFIPLQLPAAAPQPEAREIKVELRKGALSMVVTWPVSAAAELASWTAAML
jgi:transposase